MGTSAFDKLWGDEPKLASPRQGTGFDALWGKVDPVAEKRHADYLSGKLGADISTANAKDVQEATAPGKVQQVAEAIVSGFPGAQQAVSGYRGLLSLLGAGSETPEEAQSQQQRNVANMPAAARIPLQILGGVPAAALATGGAALTGGSALPTLAKYLPKVASTVNAARGIGTSGALLGGATGLAQPADDITQRLTNTGVGAVVGAAGSKLAASAGRGISNLSQRVGLTDLIEKGINKVSPSVASSLGTRGQVNTAFADRQDILDKLGENGTTAAKTQIDRIAATRAKAATLYGIAKEDVAPIQDPRLQALLNDPQIAKAMEAVSAIRSAAGTPLPRDVAPSTVPTALEKMGTTQSRYTELLALAQKRGFGHTGVDILSPELKGPSARGIEIPDPDALAKLKRYLYEAAQGRAESPLNIKQDEARALMPKVDEIRTVLHEVSPAWKTADAFYADAKGQEDAFAHGFDAFRGANNPSGEQLPTHTPEAMLKAIQEPRYPNEPASAMASRADSFRAGVRAAMASDIRGAPTTKNAKAILGTPSLSPDQATQQVRALGFASPEGVAPLEQTLATKRGVAMSTPNTGSGNYYEPPVTRYHAVRRGMRSMLDPDVLSTPQGQAMIAARQGNPSLLLQEMGAYTKGKTLTDALKQLLATSTGNQINR